MSGKSRRYAKQISDNPGAPDTPDDRDDPGDARVLRVADRQHRNVTRAQLLALGFSPSAVDRRMKAGRLHREHSGVYAVGTPARTALERAAAAVLACGPGALLSHRAALALWELGDWPRVMSVTVTRDRRRPGIVIHSCSTLTPRDGRTRQGLRVTSPARTLLDCAPKMTHRRLTRAVNEALRHRHLKHHHLAELLGRCPTHPAARRLAPFAHPHAGRPTRSALEDDFLAFCAQHRLPVPEINTMVCGYEVDAYFPGHQVIVELDGWEYHNDRAAFERDRRRDADTLEQGIVTVRITGERLDGAPEREAARLAGILAGHTPPQPRARMSAPQKL